MSIFKKYLSTAQAIGKKCINRRIVQGAGLILVAALLTVGAVIYAPQKEKAVAKIDVESCAAAGVASAMDAIDISAGESNLVYASTDVTSVAATTDQVEPDENDEYDEWADKVMANVEEYLFIRAEANEQAEPVAKLRAGDVATLVDVFDGWYEVESGNAHGFVSADYCVTGIEAYELASDVCDSYAKIDVAGLRIREEASEDSKILKVVPKGAKLTVNNDAEPVEGWIAVSSDGKSGYVKADYVQVDMLTGEAITIEEEEAAKRAAEEAAAKAKEQAEAAAAANQAVISSTDDITLMAAIIQIEAGDEPYEGQVAVGAVVVNRLHSGAYANSVHDVIFARGQFATSRMSSVIARGPKASCYQAAQEALAGSDPTGGLTHFRRAGNKEGLIIGHQVFY